MLAAVKMDKCIKCMYIYANPVYLCVCVYHKRTRFIQVQLPLMTDPFYVLQNNEGGG